MSDSGKPRFDGAALDRVLKRAAEMQIGETEIGEGMTEGEVIELGRQVGIPARYLQQAMLEERSRTDLGPAERGLDQWVGVGTVAVQRVIRGEGDRALAAVSQWMERNELVVLQRSQPTRLQWERMTGMQAALRRGRRAFGPPEARFMLARAELVTALVTPLEEGYCHLVLTAVLRRSRGSIIGGGAVVVSLGLAGSTVLGMVGAAAALLPLPIAVGLGWGWLLVRQYRPLVDRVQLGLERILDFAEQGAVKKSHELPPRSTGILGALAEEVRRALQPPAGKSPDNSRGAPPR